MTRIPRRSTSVLAQRSPGLTVKRTARRHKVILESITQKKKKLRSVISFETKAPPGYTFISAGDPHFTATCKERCRRGGLKVYAVSTTPHLHAHGLSQHVHRIGYHFPSVVVAEVCTSNGLYLTGTGKAVPLQSLGHEPSRKHADADSQITINTEARDVLRDLFPNIPDNDLNQIIKTAFQKGQRKVGTAVELPLARRAQLAVVAHIRHIYTNYDRLLKSTSFHEARATVEQPTLAKLVEWRGDDENGKTVLEDVFREVIVISDDEDSDIEAEPQHILGRDTSVEIISSNPVVEELQMRRDSHSNRALRDAPVETSEDEAAPGFRFIPEPSKKAKIDRRGFSRYQAWDRAINRYKNLASGSTSPPAAYPARDTSQRNFGLGRETSARGHIGPRQCSVGPFTLPNHKAITSILSRPPLNPVADRHPYELYPLDMPNGGRGAPAPLNLPIPTPQGRAHMLEPVKHSFQQADFPNGPVFVSGPKESIERTGDGLRSFARPQGHLQNRNVNQEDPVLPSIEKPLTVDIKRPNSGNIEHLTKRMSGAFVFRSVTPHRRQVHQDHPNHTLLQEQSVEGHNSKRRRLAYQEPIPMEKPLSPIGSTSLSTYPGNRYAVAVQPSVQSGPDIRRRYFGPVVEPYRITEHKPSTGQDSFVSTSRFDRESRTLANRGPIKVYDGQQFSHSRFVNSQADTDRSSVMARPAPGMGYPVAGGSGRDRSLQSHMPIPPESRVSQNVHGFNAPGLRAPETTGPRLEPAWWSNNIVSIKPAENQGLYADGFIRPVDIGEPEISKFRPARRLPSVYMAEDPSRPINVKLHDNQHRRVPSDSLASLPPRGRVHADSQAEAPFQQYPVSDQASGHQDATLIRTALPVYEDRRHLKNAVVPPRYGQKESPILIDT
ncbi:DUF2293 domain-containing protein [Aspergillus mulundensis]|uniref:DUF2293 domain-containing protein n=1 Tax=Aspergillus mulundensis TaxID=1810919 RepID=A0A3D8RQ57_9EURO|nr:Uncharacterized protein DSM5745_06209 [Aspergillus mulundensis]RDW76217.1 Uncharacterized protein DSM5745_06209 [Aspergillus mulundensis]